MKTTNLFGLSLSIALLAGTAAAQPPPRPPPGPPPGPPRANPTRDADLAILADVFGDAQWSEMVALDVEASAPGSGEGPRLRSLSAEATVQPVERRSIDQDVLQRIIVDRSRRLAMRAVADAVGDSVGPVMDRRYVQDLITTVSDLLTDRTGMQNTRIEALIGVLVRALLADALVRMRFPDGDVLDPCAWREQVFDQQDPPQEAAQCRAAPMPRFGERCAAGPQGAAPVDPPAGCALGSGSGETFRPWTPARTTPGARLRMRAYLIDLAYWSLGRTPLFNRRGAPPSCAFAEDRQHRSLCAFVQGAADDDERDRRIRWMLGADAAFTGIQVAQDLMEVLRPPANVHLVALVEALVEEPNLGSFRTSETRVLSRTEWAAYVRLDEWANAWKSILTLQSALADLETASDATGMALTRVRQRVAEADQVLNRTCSSPSVVTRDLCLTEGPPRTPPTPPPSAPPPTPPSPWSCTRTPVTVRGWVRMLEDTDRLDVAVARTMGTQRSRAFCTPARLQASYDRVRGGAARLRAIQNTLDRVQADASALRSGVDALAESPLPNEVSDISLGTLDDVIGTIVPIATALERLHLAVSGPDLREIARMGLPFPPRWLTDLRDVRRAVNGLGRLLQLVGVLEARVLRGRDLRTVGDVVGVLRTLGGRGAVLLERLGPILRSLAEERQLGIEVMLLVLERIPVEEIVVALGMDLEPENWCEEDEATMACWTYRALMVLREATDVDRTRVVIDGNRLVKSLGAMGEDFRRRTEWRGYFHLTIGLGEMVSYRGPDLTGTGTSDIRLVPLMAEQIGVGIASPSFFGDRLAFRTGVFASGFLYRVVLDSEESDAIMFGAFLAFDLYELLEIYLAPMVLLYPPDGEDTPDPSFGVAAGVQIPLGDYLSEL